MKAVLTLLLASALAFATAGVADDDDIHVTTSNGHMWNMDDLNIDIDDGSVIITHEDEDGKIKITDDYELYVNGKHVKTDDHQKELLTEYHGLVLSIKDDALDIGLEGAKIGLEGAGIAFEAIGGVFKMIFTDYDEDDLDRDLDRKTAKIERKAEKLEDRADEIEAKAEDLDDLYSDMADDIPEIGNLDW